MLADVEQPFNNKGAYECARNKVTIHCEDVHSPPQSNSVDCGVFVCMVAFCVVMGLDPLKTYEQKDCDFFREHLCISLLSGELPLNMIR